MGYVDAVTDARAVKGEAVPEDDSAGVVWVDDDDVPVTLEVLTANPSERVSERRSDRGRYGDIL